MLAGLVRAKVVTVYDKGEEPVYAVDRGQHLVAAFYRNNAIHWFVNRAILELALLWTSQQESDNPELTGWTEAKRIRDLLKFEFFFPDRDTFEAELRDELALISPRVPPTRPPRCRGSGVLMAHRVLRSFLDAQLVVADRLAAVDAGRAGRAGRPARRVRPRRPADAAPAPPAQPRVGLARAVHLGDRPQGQLRPAGPGGGRVARGPARVAVPSISSSSPA